MNSPPPPDSALYRMKNWWRETMNRSDRVREILVTIGLAVILGVLAGFGAVVFTELIHLVDRLTVGEVMQLGARRETWYVLLLVTPPLGLLLVAWMTKVFAPEAQGHGVPEVIYAVARQDGKIRPHVSLVKILASGICIGTGGSVGREGPIVQIGSAIGSVAGQLFRLSPRNVKVLVAAGAAAGISATFHAPIAGVVFAGEIILGTFAVESLTAVVVAAVLADVVQLRFGEHGMEPAFESLNYAYVGSWQELPTYFALGLLCGVAAVGFTELLYATESYTKRILPDWRLRAVACGLMVGMAGCLYPMSPPVMPSHAPNGNEMATAEEEEGDTRRADISIHTSETPATHELGFTRPPLFGVGYETVEHALHLETKASEPESDLSSTGDIENPIRLSRSDIWLQLLWILPLVFLKPLLTSITLAGGGSGGIFAPSLFIGATTGAVFGLVCNLLFEDLNVHPGLYAIVGMGAVVAGTTHGVLSAILIVYELTSDYRIILPIMAAAGVSSVVARLIDPESIYEKKLSRRGQSLARGHDMHRLEHVMVRNVMLRNFPAVKETATAEEIVRVARENPTIDMLPVMNSAGKLVGIIRPEDLHRVLDSEVPPMLIAATDIASLPPTSVSPDDNLLEALREFGSRDLEVLPVESGPSSNRQLVGLLLRVDVMRRYRQELLHKHS